MQCSDLASILPSVQSINEGNEHNKSSKKNKKKQRQEAPTKLAISAQDIFRFVKAILSAAISSRPAPQDIDLVIMILDDIIAGRRERVRWYQARTREDEPTSQGKDESHRHFIDTPRVVTNVVRQVRKRSQKPKFKNNTSKRSASTAGHALGSVFSALLIEEGNSDNTIDLLLSSSGTPRQSAGPHVDLELETREEDSNFALWCLLKECYDLRLYIQGIWDGFERGDMSFPTAASITDKAFTLIHGLTEDFAAVIDELSSYDKIAEDLDIQISTVGSRVEAFSYKDGRTGSADEQLDAAALLCIPAFTILGLLQKHLRYLKHEPDPDVHDRTGEHLTNGHFFGAMVIVHFSDFSLIRSDAERWHALQKGDVFTIELVRFFKSLRLDSALVIENQIYMENYDRIGRHFPSLRNLAWRLS